MPSARHAPTVSARVGALIVQVAAARGADTAQLLSESGFDPAWLNDADARMPLSVEARLWDGAAAMCGDERFGLHAAAALRPGVFDVLDYAVRTAPDLRSALRRLARYNRLVHDLALFDVVEHGETVRIEHRFAPAGAVAIAPCRHAVEFTLASLVVVASQIGGQPVKAVAVAFAHAAPVETADHQAVFGTVPRFDAGASWLTLSRALLDRPVPSADPALSRIVTAHAEQLLSQRSTEQMGVVADVRRLLAEHMSQGPLPLRETARRLHLSERSLQRRLEAEDRRYADLADEVRRDLAQQYMADPRLSLGEVAYLLGFAEPSPFHRAFKRWTGSTPAAARQHRA